MKKQLFLSLVLLFSVSALFAQKPDIVPIDETTKLITYQDVVNVEGSADTLYLRAISWINSFYKNPADVTKVRDREEQTVRDRKENNSHHGEDGRRGIRTRTITKNSTE